MAIQSVKGAASGVMADQQPEVEIRNKPVLCEEDNMHIHFDDGT